MTNTKIIFFREADGSIPLLTWLDKIELKRAKADCTAIIKHLAQRGHKLHRPYTDALRDGIRELRVKTGRVNYRLLYFFHGKNCVVISHGIIKESKVPDKEINRAISNKKKYENNPDRHSHFETEQYYE